MSSFVQQQESHRESERLGAKPPDEARSNIRISMSQDHDLRIRDSAIRAAKWLAITALLSISVFWSHAAAYEIALRSVIVVCAVPVLLDARNAGHYSVAVLFGAIGLCYNPVVPAFTFSGDWQHAVVSASIAPFAWSLFRLSPKRVTV